MKGIISANSLSKYKPKAKPYEVRDTRTKGFILRVQPSGARSYVVEWARGKRKTIAAVGEIKPAVARDTAEDMLKQAHDGKEPTLPKEGALTLGKFLEDTYRPYMEAHYPRSGKSQVTRIENLFSDLLELPLEAITPWHAEKYRTRRLKAGVSARTVNRDMQCLRACLRRASDWGKIPAHPLAKVKPIKEDKADPVRYLSVREETALMEALDAREEELRAARDRGNKWRAARKYDLLPDLRSLPFADYLKPMVLVAMHTGIRQGELFGLQWSDVSFAEGYLTIRGMRAKSSQTRHVPLNSIVLATLRAWKAQCDQGATYVFESDGKPFDNVRKSWKSVKDNAGLKNFRWHDLRHHFASRLVQAGVDLNTVRELLGHSDLKMTLRYSHLAPENKRAAVEMLTQSTVVDSKKAASHGL